MKPLAPHSLSRSGPIPQRDTPDPTSAPIRKVLTAFQGNANSSGTSTKSALDAMKDESGAVPAPSSTPSPGKVAVEMFKEESGAFAVPQRELSEPKSAPISSLLHAFSGAADKPGASATKDALDFIKEPSSSSIVVEPSVVVSSAPPTPMPTRTRAPSEAPPLPAPPVIGKSDATPSPVATEASNSTSPGSRSFAEAPSNAGRTDDTEDAVRAALVQSRGAMGIVAFLRTTRGMAIAGGAALLVIIVLVFAFKGGKAADKKTPVAAKKPVKTEVATAEKPTTDTPTTDETGSAGASAVEHVATNNGGGDEQPATGTPPTTDTPTTDTTTPPTTDTTTPPPEHTGTTTPPHTGTTGTKPPTGPKKGPTIAGKQVVLEYDSQANAAKATPNNAPQADQAAVAKARQSYAAGNQRLFAGDADGAIRNYKQALSYYPAYVAGYRGLGLAYAQQGNKPQALKALHTYLSSVPSAKDSTLIKKRIATLQAK